MRVQRHKVPRDLVLQKKSAAVNMRWTVHAILLLKHRLLWQEALIILFLAVGIFFSSRQLLRQSYAEVAGLAQNCGKKWAIATPRTSKEGQLPYFAELFAYWQKLKPDAVYISNNGLWQLAQQYSGWSLWADMPLNIYNDQNLEFWREQGAG